MPPRLADPAQDFPQWYLDVIANADLAEHADVKGCIIFKPYGYAIWEAIQADLDRRIKALDVQNAYFPLFIPESVMNKEKDHIDGFAPECAVVTHGGGKELAEKLYVRPTSETIIYSTFAKWIQSHRDLPMKVNQWCNVVRWEMRTRPFLRTLEFLWQEGHTAHATKAEADEMVEAALKMYADFDREMLALPVIRGRKPEHEKFAGALYTLTTEALARDGKAIQAGTSHNLGNEFSAAYGIGYLDEAGQKQSPWTTSWGLSTRIIGTIIVVHGDAKGLKLPPRVAPVQVVIVPIYKTDEERAAVLASCDALKKALGSVRTKIDDRDNKSPGFKFNEWETKGVPVRIEVGPRDLQEKKVTVVDRGTGEKSQMDLNACTEAAFKAHLDDVHERMLKSAEDFLKERTSTVETFAELEEKMEAGGFAWAPWDGTLETANKIKDKTKATIRLLPEGEQDVAGKKDALSGAPAVTMALFAKAY
jgi:prolyl-tRNA synthetase